MKRYNKILTQNKLPGLIHAVFRIKMRVKKIHIKCPISLNGDTHQNGTWWFFMLYVMHYTTCNNTGVQGNALGERMQISHTGWGLISVLKGR